MIRSLVVLFFMFCSLILNAQHKINGLSMAGERNAITSEQIIRAKQETAANWMALTPYSFCSVSDPNLKFDQAWQWKGETSEGIAFAINAAHDAGISVMLKPHIWVKEQGWAGDLNYDESEWEIWQQAYKNYILHYARLSDSLDVEMFCIGTEIRNSVKKHPEFWKTLIKEVRSTYHGKLVYAANWDNYENVPFWNELDYIGIDSYFPLDSCRNVDYQKLQNAILNLGDQLKTFASVYNEQILFTEFGFRSVDYAAWNHWELPDEHQLDEENFNSLNQVNCYRAFFKVLWKQPQFAGGFVWKWHPSLNEQRFSNDFSPQGKPAVEIIKLWYEAF
jgi:hypothetical protein